MYTVELQLITNISFNKSNISFLGNKGTFINDVMQRGGRGSRHFLTTGQNAKGICA